ncbi:endonuclease [Draconibacterium sp.]|nr:endonuclease [Draconibacterium sp.]
MRNKIFVLISILLFISFRASPQTKSDDLSILFYNVENLFDTRDDSLTNDNEFTPDGDRHWTYKRLNRKLLNLSKVILSSSEWNMPAIVALCEIENRTVLEQLIHFSPLKSNSYKIIHKESPDHRGIDVAFLYDFSRFYPLNYRHLPLRNKNNSIIKTREILYVSGILDQKDTLHFFINHWPSRYGGLLETKPERKLAATVLRQKVDELSVKFIAPKIVILGDFNDQPNDESLAKILNAQRISSKPKESELYNLSYDWLAGKGGTLKYQSQWSVYDQIVVSGALLNSSSGFITKPENAQIINHSFLLEKDEKYGGYKPLRTYFGFQYQGGFSDHLPILLKLENID